MAWIYLLIAGALEVFWATCLKASEEFTKPLESIATILGMIVSFYFLAKAMKVLPLGTSYAVWTGIGALGTVIIGVVFFKESMDLRKMIFLAFLLIGILGLKFTTAEHEGAESSKQKQHHEHREAQGDGEHEDGEPSGNGTGGVLCAAGSTQVNAP